MARLAFGCPEQALDIEGDSLRPTLEGRRGKQIVELHRQLEAIFRGEELLDLECPEPLKGGSLYLADQLG